MRRRDAILKLGGLGLGALGLGALWRTTQSNGATLAPGPVAGADRLPAAQCILAPELTEGPYYIASEPLRRDITEGRPGAPLEIDFTIQDAACKPIKGATVEIWHADALGSYSGFNEPGNFLRGQQTTNKDGEASFKTIYPGWYAGRAVHIHMKVHVGGATVHTGQLFFDDAFSDKLFASTAPYNTRGQRDTLNSDDNIFAGGGSSTVLRVKQARNKKGRKKKGSYEAKISLGVS